MQKTSYSRTPAWIVMLAILFSGFCFSAQANEKREKLFSSDETLSVTIEGPWSEVLRTKDDTRWPASIQLSNSTGEMDTIPLTIERRGKSRQRVCKFPPIRLRFDKDDARDTIFQGEGALKLVTHCDNGSRWTQYYVKEMLAYQIYNLFTDYSFRVRPLEIRYLDTNKGEKEAEPRFAFLIENAKEVAKKLDLKELKVKSTLPSQLDAEVASRHALFQYLIGNLDWSPIQGPDECCHNAKLIGPEDLTPPLYAVPYDFDASGIVDAHYATPPDGMGIRSVTVRRYRGFCAHTEALPAARAHIQSLQSEIVALVADEPRLNDRTRKKTLKYLEDFFEVLNDEKKFDREITSKCR